MTHRVHRVLFLALSLHRDIHTFGVYVVMYEVLSRELEKYNVPKAPKAILAGGFSGLFHYFIVVLKYFRSTICSIYLVLHYFQV